MRFDLLVSMFSIKPANTAALIVRVIGALHALAAPVGLIARACTLAWVSLVALVAVSVCAPACRSLVFGALRFSSFSS